MCPTIEERDPLNVYLEVGGDEVYIAMNTLESTSEDDPQITCYWVIRPERNLWQPELSQLTVWVEQIDGGDIFVFQGSQRSNITDSIID